MSISDVAPPKVGRESDMQQLTYIAPNQLEWREVPDAQLDSDYAAIVKPLAVARCDIDLLLATGLIPGKQPYALGHECTAEILELGAADDPRDQSRGSRDGVHHARNEARGPNECLTVPRRPASRNIPSSHARSRQHGEHNLNPPAPTDLLQQFPDSHSESHRQIV